MSNSKSSNCKLIMTVLFFMGFMLHHMLRINMSIAIVDMVVTNETKSINVTRFIWTEHEKHDVIGCFFWSYGIISLVAGHLSEIYGTKRVMGGGVLLATICTILTPMSSYLNYYCLLIARVGVGLGLGIEWSSVMPLIIKWIEPNHISKFVAHLMASQLGAALSLLTCGFLIDWFGWPSVFYVTGSIGVIWCVAWFYFVYDSPGQHPRISVQERESIEQKVNYDMKDKKKKEKPWARIMTSVPVWAIFAANSALMFNVNFAANYVPLFMDRVLHLNIKSNGFWGSMPFIVAYVIGLLSSTLADKWRKSKFLSPLNIRKIFTTLALGSAALTLTIESFWGYNKAVSISIFIIWQALLTCAAAGHIPNAVDISPSYSGTIHGVATGFGGLAGYLSTKMVGLLLKNEEDFQEWQLIFWILVCASIVGWVVYLLFASTTVQVWNNNLKVEQINNFETLECIEKGKLEPLVIAQKLS